MENILVSTASLDAPSHEPELLVPSPGPRFDIAVGDVTHRSSTIAELREKGVPEAILLGVLKDRLKAAIDAKAETIRAMVTTPGTGQAMEYQEAQTQAAAALKASTSATPEKYPMLAASIGIDIDPQTGAPATDVVGVARAVMAAYQAWQAIGAEIRKVRLAGKAAIDAALTDEEAAAAYSAVIWPALGLNIDVAGEQAGSARRRPCLNAFSVCVPIP